MLFSALAQLFILLYSPPNRTLLKTEQAIAFPDADPISEGHTLVAPRQHISSIDQLSVAEQKALWEFVDKVREWLLKGFMADRLYIGFNDGASAGQNVAHTHIHIIPLRGAIKGSSVLPPRPLGFRTPPLGGRLVEFTEAPELVPWYPPIAPKVALSLRAP